MSDLSLLPQQAGVEYRYCVGYCGYAVSTVGDVWSCHTRGSKYGLLGKWCKLKPHMSYGRVRVRLSAIPRGQVNRLVHMLVLEAFVGPCPVGMEACHFPDRNPTNNQLCNLRWDTHVNNLADSVVHGTRPYGEQKPAAKLTAIAVQAIREAYACGGISYQTLANQYGVSISAISFAVRRKQWKHVA